MHRRVHRIAVARTLLGQPAIPLRDEADSHLNSITSRFLDWVVGTFAGTVLLGTHRRERPRDLDVVWHVEGGQIIETGPPADLLRGDGPTARLFADARQAVA